jgi:hypothetical protein
MSASGGMGTLNPPSDNDDVAKVTPLRRRDAHLFAVPTVRDPLPAETSVWDTDEPGEPRLRAQTDGAFAAHSRSDGAPSENESGSRHGLRSGPGSRWRVSRP